MTGASHSIFFSSTSSPSAVAVKTFVFEAMPKSVRPSTWVDSPSFRTPYPFATTTASSLTMARPMPGTSNVRIARATHWSRSGGAAGAELSVTTAAAQKTVHPRNCRRCMSREYTGIMSDQEFAVTKTDDEWKSTLSPEQFYVLRQHGTERPGTSPLNYEKRSGLFKCAACGQSLFTGDT